MPAFSPLYVHPLLRLLRLMDRLSTQAFAVAAAGGLPVVSASASRPPRGWLYRTQLTCIKVHSTGTTYEIMIPDTVEFDIGAMRKVDNGILFMVMEANEITNTAATVTLSGLIRTMYLN